MNTCCSMVDKTSSTVACGAVAPQDSHFQSQLYTMASEGNRNPVEQVKHRMEDMCVPNSVGSTHRRHSQSKNQYFLMSSRLRTLPEMSLENIYYYQLIVQIKSCHS